MPALTPQQQAIFDVVFAMEGGIADVERWSKALMNLGCCETDLAAGGVYVIGEALEREASTLRAQWRQVFELARSGQEDSGLCAVS